MSMRIKRNDTVQVISGEDAGKVGRVLQVQVDKQRVLIEGINIVKRAQRRTQENQQGGFAEKEAPIAISKVLLYHPELKKGVRVSADRTGAKAVRKCRKTGHVFE